MCQRSARCPRGCANCSDSARVRQRPASAHLESPRDTAGRAPHLPSETLRLVPEPPTRNPTSRRGAPRGLRHGIQTAWTLLTNSYLAGFAQGKIYKGPLKNLCVPGLNCYSCPGALGSCPIGALQAVIGSARFSVTLYVAGFLMLVGALAGRFVCGWLCPFGLIQELLHKIPLPRPLRKIATFRGDRPLRLLKYIILVVFVILMPLFVVDLLGQGAPWFCKLLCPVGTLEGGIPLVALNKTLRAAVGWLYTWKVALLIGLVALSVVIYRPFCRYLCPLGAIYSAFNPIAMLRHRVDVETCIGCEACRKACPMQVDPVRTPNHPECVRCGACVRACPTGALRTTDPRWARQPVNCGHEATGASEQAKTAP